MSVTAMPPIPPSRQTTARNQTNQRRQRSGLVQRRYEVDGTTDNRVISGYQWFRSLIIRSDELCDVLKVTEMGPGFKVSP